MHAVEDRPTTYLPGFADSTVDGLELGDHVSDYTIEYTDGTESVVPVLRRFAIQQSRSGWGSAPFAAVAADDDEVFPSGDESALLRRPLLTDADLLESPGPGLRDAVAELYGWAHETRIRSAYTRGMLHGDGSLWLYALGVPDPSRPIRAVTCAPREERSTLYALAATGLSDHPLRARMRQKLRVQVPDGFSLNGVDELEEVGIGPRHGDLRPGRARVRRRGLAHGDAGCRSDPVPVRGGRRVPGSSERTSLRRRRRVRP